MKRLAFAASLVGAALLVAPAPAAETVAKIGLILPPGDAYVALGAETSYGVALAVEESASLRAAGAKRPAVETVALTAGDAATATAAVEDAAKKHVAGLIAIATAETAAPLEAAARKAKLPLILLGPAGPTRSLDRADPVLRVEPPAADRGLALAEALRFRSGRATVGLPAQTKRAWLVVEDAPWARDIESSLRTDDLAALAAPGASYVRVAAPLEKTEIDKARAAGADRIVVIGCGAVLRAATAALDTAAWTIPVLATDAALDGGASAVKGRARGLVFVAASPAWAGVKRIVPLVERRAPPAGKGASLTPAATRAFVAAAAMAETASGPAKPGVLAALRELRDGTALGAPLFDVSGSVDRWTWATWAASDDGSIAPVKPTFLPDAGLGPLLGANRTSLYHADAGAVCVRVGFGGAAGTPPRTVEADLATLGLGTSDPSSAPDVLAREQIVGRTLGKLSRIWLHAYDGTERPSVSFRIAFVADGADTKGASAVWDAHIAGDGPDGLHGGQTLTKTACQALSTFLLRNAAPLHAAKLDPPLAVSDVPYLDGSYVWNSSAAGNLRSDRIRALVDGVASTYAMKLSKEIGHLAGLAIDGSGDSRSVMVTKGGEGVSDDLAYFPAPFAKVLEKTLGRAAAR